MQPRGLSHRVFGGVMSANHSSTWFPSRPAAHAGASGVPEKGKGGVLAEGKWTTQHEIHTPLETHVCVAKWESSQELTIFLSTQACDLMAREIAKAFDLLPENVNLICRNVGGAFGSKLGLTTETLAAIRLSRAADLPVKVELTRREEMTVGGSRPGTEINLALRAGKNGAIEALTATAYTNSGVGINSIVASLMRFVYPERPGTSLTATWLPTLHRVNHSGGRAARKPAGPSNRPLTASPCNWIKTHCS